MSILAKIGRQPEETWSALHGRLSSLEFKLDKVLPSDEVRDFTENKAKSLSCCCGYILAGILSTVLFVTGITCSLVTPSGQETKPNIFHLICGPPSTGKSQAVKDSAIDIVNTISKEKGHTSPIIQKCTSSGLTKILSSEHKGYMVCTEIFDVLYKLLRGDGDSSSGDTSLFCELFSGEQVSFSFGSQAQRDKPQKMPFCIYGSIQIFPLAKIIALLDQGHGLLDRFLIAVPLCLRPTPISSMESRENLKQLRVSSFTDIISNVSDLLVVPQNFTFSSEASTLIKEMEEDFINQINEAISSGQVPPKSKKLDLVMRVALALHIFSHVTKSMLKGDDLDSIPEEVPVEHLEAAVYYVSYCEMQKAILSQFVKDVVASAYDPPTFCPSINNIKTGLLLFPGKIVTFTAFRSSGPRSLRSVSEEEFRHAVDQMPSFGKVLSLRVPRSRRQTVVFVKKNADLIKDEDWPSDFSKENYVLQFNKPIHVKITPNIRRHLAEVADVPADDIA